MLKISVFLLLVVVVAVGGRATADRTREYLNVDSEEAKEIADKAAYSLNDDLNPSPESFYHKLVKICDAFKWKAVDEFYLRFILGETTCTKKEATYEEAKQCDIKEEAFRKVYRECMVIFTPKDKSRGPIKSFDCSNEILKSEISDC